MPAMFIFELPLRRKTGRMEGVGLNGERVSLGLGAVIRDH